jgi:hypothetical protein
LQIRDFLLHYSVVREIQNGIHFLNGQYSPFQGINSVQLGPTALGVNPIGGQDLVDIPRRPEVRIQYIKGPGMTGLY